MTEGKFPKPWSPQPLLTLSTLVPGASALCASNQSCCCFRSNFTNRSIFFFSWKEMQEGRRKTEHFVSLCLKKASCCASSKHSWFISEDLLLVPNVSAPLPQPLTSRPVHSRSFSTLSKTLLPFPFHILLFAAFLSREACAVTSSSSGNVLAM